MAQEIFISYSRHDKDKVFPFVDQINKEVGTDCWIDLQGIESGEQFEEVIIKAIEKCQVVLFMLSDSSLKSEWTKREVYYAEDEGKRIVPVLVNGKKLRGWYKFHFGNVDFIDIDNAEQKMKLARNLRTWIGTTAKGNEATDERHQLRNVEPRQASDWYHKVYPAVVIWALLVLFVVGCALWRCSSQNKNTIITVTDSTYVNPIMGEYTYSGEIDKDGKPHGIGQATFGQGDIYIGHFNHGIFEGECTYLNYEAGDKFVGYYKDNHRDSGTYVWEDGTYFTGTFKEDSLFKGILYDINGRILEKY